MHYLGGDFFLFSVIILHGFWRWGRREKWALLCSIRFCSAQCSQKFSEIIAILATNTFQLSYSGGLHSCLISPSKSNFSLIFSCLKLKLLQTFWGLLCTLTSSKIFEAIDLRNFPRKYLINNILNWFQFQKTETFADNQTC